MARSAPLMTGRTSLAARSSQLAALNLLIAHEMIDDPRDGDESITDRMLIVQLSSAICVAMVQARAELQRELTAQSADSDG